MAPTEVKLDRIRSSVVSMLVSMLFCCSFASSSRRFSLLMGWYRGIHFTLYASATRKATVEEERNRKETRKDGRWNSIPRCWCSFFLFHLRSYCSLLPLQTRHSSFFLLWALVLFIIILFFCQAEWWKSRNLLWILLISFSSHDFRVNQEKNRVSIDFTEFCRVFNELEEEVWLHGNRVPEPIESIGLQAPSRFTSWTILYRFFK